MSTSLFFSYRGRVNRRQFWFGFFGYMCAVCLTATGAQFLTRSMLVPLLSPLPFLPFFFAVTTKRYHDQGKSGWNNLWLLAPFVGWVYVIVECGFWKGSPLRNEYGDPLYGPLVQEEGQSP